MKQMSKWMRANLRQCLQNRVKEDSVDKKKSRLINF